MAELVQKHQVSALVVDPVLVATSGDSLAGSQVAQALKAYLFPLATVITPNLPEASALLADRRVDDLDSMKEVRREKARTPVHAEVSQSEMCIVVLC